MSLRVVGSARGWPGLALATLFTGARGAVLESWVGALVVGALVGAVIALCVVTFVSPALGCCIFDWAPDTWMVGDGLGVRAVVVVVVAVCDDVDVFSRGMLCRFLMSNLSGCLVI